MRSERRGSPTPDASSCAVRGAHHRASALLWVGWAGRPLGRAEAGGVLGACPPRGGKQRRPIPIAADPRRRRPARGAAPLRLGSALPLTRTVHRDATMVVVFVEESAPRPGGCVLSAHVLEPAPLSRSAFCERPHGRTGCRAGVVFSPSLIESINSFSVVAPVVMWAGQRAVQGPGVGRRPSPGRHVHGRVVRGRVHVRLGSRRSLDGMGRRVLGACSRRRGSSGLPGHVARNGRGSIPIAADPRRSESARGADSLRLGWDCPSPDGPPGRDEVVVVRRAVLPASRRLRPLGLMLSNPLRFRGARSANGLTVARGVGVALFRPGAQNALR